MKKIFMINLIVILLSSLASIAFANPDKEYLHGDKNYIFCGSSMGAGYFVDRNSFSVEKYNPPQYIISVDIVRVANYFNNGRDEFTNRSKRKFLYDYSTRKVYIYTPNAESRQDMKSRYESQVKKIDTSLDWNSDWVILGVFYGEGTGHYDDAAEIAFALAYKLKFRGGKYYEDYYRLIGGVKDSL